MKAWDSAAFAGLCAYAGELYAKGDRVVIVQTAYWRKVYCSKCGLSNHPNVGPDTGQVLEAQDGRGYPIALARDPLVTARVSEAMLKRFEATLPQRRLDLEGSEWERITDVDTPAA